MKFKVEKLSDQGSFRKNNQDFLGFEENKYGQFLAVVCDGMGGHAHGEVASKLACETLLDLFSKEDFSKYNKARMNKWFRLATFAIKNKMEQYAFSHPDTLDMGTTLTALLITEQGAFVLNIGDSRTYKLINHHIQQITVDQNLLNENFSISQTTKNKNRVADLGLDLNQVTYWKVLVSALGPTKTLKIDTFYLKDPIGKYVLTTDGVHDALSDEDFAEILTNEQKLKNQTKQLVELAKINLSKDNLSVLIVEVD